MWKVGTGPASAVNSEQLKVSTAVAGTWTVLAESELETVGKGRINEIPVRIPVPPGAGFGVHSTSAGVLVCSGGAGDSYDYFSGDVPVGASQTATATETAAILALAVVVEPDADRDGFGDETQDGCPTDPLVQGGCPTVVPPSGGGGGSISTPLGLTLKAKLEGNVVALRLTGSEKATVSVSDTVRGRAIGGPKPVSVEPGQTARAYLPLSAAVKRQLAKLPRKRDLDLVVEAKGQSVAGAVGSVSAELTLRGRKKPQRHRHHHPRHAGFRQAVFTRHLSFRESRDLATSSAPSQPDG